MKTIRYGYVVTDKGYTLSVGTTRMKPTTITYKYEGIIRRQGLVYVKALYPDHEPEYVGAVTL